MLFITKWKSQRSGNTNSTRKKKEKEEKYSETKTKSVVYHQATTQLYNVNLVVVVVCVSRLFIQSWFCLNVEYSRTKVFYLYLNQATRFRLMICCSLVPSYVFSNIHKRRSFDRSIYDCHMYVFSFSFYYSLYRARIVKVHIISYTLDVLFILRFW